MMDRMSWLRTQAVKLAIIRLVCHATVLYANLYIEAKKAKEIVAEEDSILENVNKGFRVYFPSQDTVCKSKGGPGVSAFTFHSLHTQYRED